MRAIYILIFISFIAIMAMVYDDAKTDQLRDDVVSTQQALIYEQMEKIDKLRQMIERDDNLLNGLLHDTWRRDCEYERIAGTLLADGSVRETLIQRCEND